jgi:hypothetical protein
MKSFRTYIIPQLGWLIVRYCPLWREIERSWLDYVFKSMLITDQWSDRASDWFQWMIMINRVTNDEKKKCKYRNLESRHITDLSLRGEHDLDHKFFRTWYKPPVGKNTHSSKIAVAGKLRNADHPVEVFVDWLNYTVAIGRFLYLSEVQHADTSKYSLFKRNKPLYPVI